MKKIRELIDAAKMSNEGGQNRKTLEAIEALAAHVETLEKKTSKKK